MKKKKINLSITIAIVAIIAVFAIGVSSLIPNKSTTGWTVKMGEECYYDSDGTFGYTTFGYISTSSTTRYDTCAGGNTSDYSPKVTERRCENTTDGMKAAWNSFSCEEVAGIGSYCANGACTIPCNKNCAGKACGPDGCGGNCGTCSENQTCSGGQCLSGCVPLTCSQLGKNCGFHSDGCGGNLFCGNCVNNTCVDGVCSSNITITCYNNNNCPPSTAYACVGNFSCSNTTAYNCINPGAVNSYCALTGSSVSCGNCALGCDLATGRCLNCANECSSNGARICESPSYYRICGNYDTDSCLEWSSSYTYKCEAGTVCSDGNCVLNQTCTDSDGENYGAKGTCTDSSGSHVDLCDTQTAAGDWICTSPTGYCEYHTLGCPYYSPGYICSDGKCAAGKICNDTDGGYNIYQKGTVNATDYPLMTDICWGNTTLSEFYCSGSTPANLNVSCATNTTTRCSNSICI